MPKSKKRKGAAKYEPPKTYEEKQDRHLKSKIFVEMESFYTIDSLIRQLRKKDWLEECQGTYFFKDEKNQDIDLIHGLKRWLGQWKSVSNHAVIEYDDTPLKKIIAKLENGSIMFDSDLDALENLIEHQRQIYRKLPKEIMQAGVDDYLALEEAAKRIAA